jgi:hypothetical protein
MQTLIPVLVGNTTNTKPLAQAGLAILCNARQPLTALVMRRGQRFESARRLFLLSRFAGKTSSDAEAPALRWGRFTATRLPQSTHHSACRLIFDGRRYLAPLRGNGAITTGRATWNRRSNPGAPLVDQLRIPLCPETRCSRRDYHLGGSCWPGSSYQGDGPAPAAASGTQTSRRIVKRHKGIKGQPPMRFGLLSLEALLQRHERAAYSSKQEPWTVPAPQRVATSIEPATGLHGP